LNFFHQKYLQGIAFILAHMKVNKASVIIQKFPLELLGDVACRITAMDHVNPELIREIERVLEKKLRSMSSEDNEDYECYIDIDDYK
jgi:flagellar motor switch protein FliG